MSYDIFIVDKNGNPMLSPVKHEISGGTYCDGGTNILWLNVTYNYARPFRKAFKNADGIRILQGMSCLQSIPIIHEAVSRLKDTFSENYWAGTEGNAKLALCNLLQLAALGCGGFWRIE